MRCAVFLLPNGVCDKTTENRHQRTDNRNQRTEIRKQTSEDRKQETEIRRQVSESRYQKTDVRNQQTENGNQQTENGKQKTKIRNQISRLQAVSCLRVSDPRLPAVFLFPRTKVFRNMLGNDPLCVFCPCIER